MGTHRRVGQSSPVRQLCGNNRILEHLWSFVQTLESVFETVELPHGRPVLTQGINAVQGRDGLLQGIEWLRSQVDQV